MVRTERKSKNYQFYSIWCVKIVARTHDLAHSRRARSLLHHIQGRIQDFKLGGALKKLRRAEGGANIFGVFRMENHDFTSKNHIFFPILGGARAGCAPPLDPPLTYAFKSTLIDTL
jgi:hypothetical protein